MTTETHEIVCGACNVKPEPVADTQPQRWRCPSCGIDDTQEDILGEAREHGIEVGKRAVQDAARDLASKISFMTYSGEELPDRTFRWVTAFKLDLRGSEQG